MIGAHQDVCPWNVRFAHALGEPAFAARGVLAGKGPRTLAREILQMSQEEFSAAFKGSPMKRAKRRGLKRNAAVVLGNVGTSDDVDVLTRAFDDDEALVREHAAWALGRIGTPENTEAPATRMPRESDEHVEDELRSARHR